jgi:hypothetical protein
MAKEFKEALVTCVKLLQNTAYKEDIQGFLTKQAISNRSILKSLSPFLANARFPKSWWKDPIILVAICY